jgi:hypothetical protein
MTSVVLRLTGCDLLQASFNWFGFLSAMGSNVTFQSRNVLSKKLLIKKVPAPLLPPPRPRVCYF